MWVCACVDPMIKVDMSWNWSSDILTEYIRSAILSIKDLISKLGCFKFLRFNFKTIFQHLWPLCPIYCRNSVRRNLSLHQFQRKAVELPELASHITAVLLFEGYRCAKQTQQKYTLLYFFSLLIGVTLIYTTLNSHSVQQHIFTTSTSWKLHPFAKWDALVTKHKKASKQCRNGQCNQQSRQGCAMLLSLQLVHE